MENSCNLDPTVSTLHYRQQYKDIIMEKLREHWDRYSLRIMTVNKSEENLLDSINGADISGFVRSSILLAALVNDSGEEIVGFIEVIIASVGLNVNVHVCDVVLLIYCFEQQYQSKCRCATKLTGMNSITVIRLWFNSSARMLPWHSNREG